MITKVGEEGAFTSTVPKLLRARNVLEQEKNKTS